MRGRDTVKGGGVWGIQDPREVEGHSEGFGGNGWLSGRGVNQERKEGKRGARCKQSKRGWGEVDLYCVQDPVYINIYI